MNGSFLVFFQLQTEEEEVDAGEQGEPPVDVPADIPPDGVLSPTLDGLENEPLLLEPPPPPKPKAVLQEVDLTPFMR